MWQNLETFCGSTLPGILNKNFKLADLISLMDFSTPLLYLEDEDDNLDVWSLTSTIKSSLGLEIKVVWCGNCTWEQIEDELNFCFWKGNLIVLVGVDVKKQEDFFQLISEWYRAIHDRVEDYLYSHKLSDETRAPKG